MSAALLLVYGATGGTGVPLVTKALSSGLRVRAFVRDPSKLPPDCLSNPNLEPFKGDISDQSAVTAALEGAKYVICVAGGPAISASMGMSKLAAAVANAMPHYAVTRFLYQAGAVSPMPGETLRWSERVVRFFATRIPGVGNVIADNDKAIEELHKSEGIEWVVCRPGFIVNGESRGRLKESDKIGQRVAYKDLADFNLQLVQTNQYNGKGVYPAYE